MTFSYKLRRYKTKSERELDVPGLRVMETVNDRFATAINYLNFCHLNKLSCYVDNIAHEFQKLAKKIAR